MFRNKILVSAQLASPSSSPFFLLHISLSDSSSHIEIETLCWKLSRRLRLACFRPLPSSPTSIFVIYQRNQADSAAKVIEEIDKTLAVINVGEEEEVTSATLLSTAVECWFRSLMLEKKTWRCIGDSTFVESTFAGDEEKNHFHALNVRVQSGKGGDLVFLVSPDVIWFTRNKISDLVPSRTLQSFCDGNIAVVEKDSLFTSCTVLPYLYNGHIIELSKLPPVAQKFEMLEELWLIKHGLNLLSDHYVNVHFIYGGQASNQWLPSAFVLRGSGLHPAPQTVRTSMALNALNSFIKMIGCSDFFSQGLLKVKEVSSLETPIMQPVWKVVGTACVDKKNIISAQESTIDQCITFENLHLTLDFRSQKPAHRYISANRILDCDISYSAAALSREEMTEATMKFSVKPPILKTIKEVEQVIVKAPLLIQSQVYQRESGQRNDIVSVFKPGSAAFNASEGSILEQRNVNNLPCSSKDAREKVMSDTLDDNSSSKVKKAEKNNASSKSTSGKENKISFFLPTDSKEGKSEACMKKKKANLDSSDVNSKVFDFHSRGKLQSLTVPDLKCFLAGKKAKVGGKKEELILRVISIFSSKENFS